MFFPVGSVCPPAIQIIAALVVAAALLAYTLVRDGPPKFEDPVIGFEPRGTPMANRLNSWRLLHESTGWNGPLSLYPKIRNDSVVENSTKIETKVKSTPKKRRNKKKSKSSSKNSTVAFEAKNHGSSESFFCGKIVEDYVHFVVESTDGQNLLELDSLRNLCHLDKKILRQHSDCNRTSESPPETRFCHYCEMKNMSDCCPSWSLANYILLLANKTTGDCDSITTDDIDLFVQLLRDCSPYYAGQYLSEDCWSIDSGSNDQQLCPNMPKECVRNENLVFNVFHYLVDYRFLGMRKKILQPETLSYENQTEFLEPFLSATSIFLPMAKNSHLIPYYESISKSISNIEYGNVRVSAADIGLKYALFNKLIVADLILPCTACLLILISLILFTRSFLLTTMAMITNIASLAIAYFLYTHLFSINFFPFLNLLSLIILVAIGSDNALIFCKAWSCCRQTAMNQTPPRRTSDYETELSAALRHVLVSAFCASFTTGGAFLAGYFSDITSLKCFSIFSALSIVANFVITAVTFPAAIFISDRMATINTGGASKNSKSVPLWCRWLHSVSHWWSSTDCFLQYFFDNIILKLVFNYHRILVIVLSIISVLSATIVLYRPGLRLPDSQEFQLFSSQHLFERYDLIYKNLFWFSRVEKTPQQQQQSDLSIIQMDQSNNLVLPIRVVFGILPEDNGNSLNPFDRGKIDFDLKFNISSEQSQAWLLDFCREIRAQTFYKSTLGPMLTNCFIETFQSWMETRKCREVIGDQIFDHYPCCELTRFPYEPAVFDQCLMELVERLHRTTNFIYQAHQAGPRFNATTGRVKAFVMEYDSVYDALATAGSYDQTREVWNHLNRWIEQRLALAPPGLRNGWFVTTNMEFYALQESLSTGVVRSLFIAVLFAFVTLVGTTWNIRLSLLSILTITGIIFTSVASLVLLGWHLNIIESMIISLTIGLSIDATLHYTIAYKMLTKGNRLLGIQMTVARVGSPVAMGALTTFVAGAIMLLSQVLAYIQIGTFLMVISGVSLIFSSLFHLSLLILFGSDDPGGSSNGAKSSSTTSWWSIIKSIVPRKDDVHDQRDSANHHLPSSLPAAAASADNNNDADLIYSFDGTEYGTLTTRTLGTSRTSITRCSQDFTVCYHVTSI